MTITQRVDLAILGGGCAGLSLAKCLSLEDQWNKETLVIEARDQYSNDRSWCFWEPKDKEILNHLAPLITHKWPHWQFSGNQFRVAHQVKERQYCYIPSDRFYQNAIDSINQHPKIQLWNGKEILSVSAEKKGFIIRMSDGTSVFSEQVVDTRPQLYSESTQATLWQIFYGVEIHVSKPIFDATCVGLMENLTASSTGTQFVYILPFSAQHALIEWTVFTPELFAPEQLAPLLHQWLSSQFGNVTLQITRTEQAVLPMGLKPNHVRLSKQNYSFGGQVAGAIRPATGYAFLRICRWAQECAKQIAMGQVIKARVGSTWMVKAMDALFLSILHDQPQLGVSLFQALAQRVPPAVLVRFLSDEARFLDYFYVMRALPTKLFLSYGLNINQWLNPLKTR